MHSTLDCLEKNIKNKRDKTRSAVRQENGLPKNKKTQKIKKELQ